LRFAISTRDLLDKVKDSLSEEHPDEFTTTRHQPSLTSRSQLRTFMATRAREKPPHPRAQNMSGQDYGNKTIKRNTARGRFVKCGDCAKPRVIYSDTAPSRRIPLDCDGRVPSSEEDASCQALVAEALS
jgi:hypothetical protein